MSRWVKLALKLTQYSKRHQHKMAAVIVRGGSVISSATNSHAIEHGTWSYSKHAEARAIHPHQDMSGGTIVIAREGNRMSKPCPKCMELIRKAGISKIVYSNWDGEIVSERVAA